MAVKVKPKVFIASSSETRPVVEALLEPLDVCANILPWWVSDAFNKEDTTFGTLLTAIRSYDFAIFVIAADDLTKSRKSTKFTVRDNVLFELGLFMGQLGRDRVTAILEELNRPDEIKMPSDLLGVLMPRFRRNDKVNLVASIQRIAPAICERIQQMELRHFAFNLKKSWNFEPTEQQFWIDLDSRLVERNRTLIGGKQSLLDNTQAR